MMGLQRTPSVYSQDDPISLAMRPSLSETEIERRVRLEREAEAKRISETIDEQLRLEREHLKKRKQDVKLLLLGQAESGKSTLQKQFQLLYKPHSLEEERSSWRTVVYFNLIHSIKKVLGTLEAWGDRCEESGTSATNADDDEKSLHLEIEESTIRKTPSSSSQMSFSTEKMRVASQASPHPKDSSAYQIANLRRRLSPLIASELQLANCLSGGISVSGGKGGIYARSGWQSQSSGLTVEEQHRSLKSRDNFSPTSGPSVAGVVGSVALMLSASKYDIRELWEHPTVRALIARRRLRLEEWAEFFLNNILRICEADYVPTTDDILRARIQTMGVAEHVFDVNLHGKVVNWHLYDVGGARGQRHSWVPYFDDANAIIFVAPISAFDQYLEEDSRTNRIDDSLQLFTQICSNQLLKSVHLVLFLNKTDLLRKKLENGLKVQKYITSFGNRENDYDTVVQYFRAHFLQAHRKNNENRRVLYTHLTSVVDTKTTQRIIANVRDSIFRGYLQSASLV